MMQSSRGCVRMTLGFRQVCSADSVFAGSCLCTERLVLPLHLLICIFVCVLQFPFTTAKVLCNLWVIYLPLPVTGA